MDTFCYRTKFVSKNISLVAFVIAHTLFVIFLGRLYDLAPDESGYIFTFNNIYTFPLNTPAQTASCWIAVPIVFLWVVYLPAKILNVLGLPDFLAIRILSILLTAVTVNLLFDISRKTIRIGKSSQRKIFAVFPLLVFLWTSIGLRKPFVIVEVAVFLISSNYFVREMSRKGMLHLFLGSFGIVSTMNYLWGCLMGALIVSAIFT